MEYRTTNGREYDGVRHGSIGWSTRCTIAWNIRARRDELRAGTLGPVGTTSTGFALEGCLLLLSLRRVLLVVVFFGGDSRKGEGSLCSRTQSYLA